MTNPLDEQHVSRSIIFDSSPQDVLTVLGHPQHISYKTADPQAIHTPSAFKSQPKRHIYQPDYFYNYFDFGIDILFDGLTHNIKKFILHTNTPAQPNFNLYRKCHYTIIAPKENDPQDSQDLDLEGKVTNTINPEMKVNIIE